MSYTESRGSAELQHTGRMRFDGSAHCTLPRSSKILTPTENEFHTTYNSAKLFLVCINVVVSDLLFEVTLWKLPLERRFPTGKLLRLAQTFNFFLVSLKYLGYAARQLPALGARLTSWLLYNDAARATLSLRKVDGVALLGKGLCVAGGWVAHAPQFCFCGGCRAVCLGIGRQRSRRTLPQSASLSGGAVVTSTRSTTHQGRTASHTVSLPGVPWRRCCLRSWQRS